MQDSYLFRPSPSVPVSLPGEMWGITAYFNPAAYSNKREHLRLFSRRARQQGLKLLVVELAPQGAPREVPDDCADIVVRLTSDTVLWHKERLFNIGLSRLPGACDKVALVDGDVLFENDQWVEEAARLLERYVVVQPFQLATWLAPGCFSVGDRLKPSASAPCYRPGLAFGRMWHPPEVDLSERPDLVHPGFAWAVRRDVLDRCGIYDKFIIGGGDLILAAAACGCPQSWNQHKTPGLSAAQSLDVAEWISRFRNAVQGSVSCTRGLVAHLWHGDPRNRQYTRRYEVLTQYDFDPVADITLDANLCWRWATNKPRLHEAVADYFAARNEDC